MENKRQQIRNSTAEFLIFTKRTEGEIIEVRVQEGTVWLPQKLISVFFDVERSVATKHLNNIYQENELNKEATCAFFAHVQTEGARTGVEVCIQDRLFESDFDKALKMLENE